MTELYRLLHASAHDIPLPDGSVQCIVTSPPYWGLRAYAGEQVVEWPAVTYRLNEWTEPVTVPAMRSPLGLEPSPVAFVGHLILCLREWRRVLRDDGVAFVNLGDSYANTGSANSGGSNQNDGGVPHRLSGMPVKSGGLKPKDLCGIPWLFAMAARADGWWLRSDVIWCLSGGTRVYAKTQKGEMPMTIKDMVRLDPSTVKLWNGEKWTQVLGWSESPRPDEPIEIELRSGERIGCTPNHEWPTMRGLVRADELRVGDVIRSTRLPQPTNATTPEFMPPSIGWFVGLYIAEGSRSGDTIQIASHIDEEERYKRLCRFADGYGGTCARHITSENGMTINLNGKVLNAIIDTYVSGRTARDKHLSMACWQRNDGFLHDLVWGYLSGDGHRDTENDRWRLGFTRNYNLAADLRTLAARLDAQLRLKLSTSGEFKTFRGEWRWRASTYHNAKPNTEVVRIGRSRARKFWDIGVEDEPHLFALASGVLTHNSKPNPMPESVTDRPTSAHEHVFLLAKSSRYYYDADAVREPHARLWGENNGGSMAKTELAELAVNMEGSQGWNHKGDYPLPNPAGRNLRNVWHIATAPFAGAHFATFPPKLVEPCIRAGTSARGCCPECGAPWERVVERTSMVVKPGPSREERSQNGQLRTQVNGTMLEPPTSTTVGWRPTCEHDAEPVPCVVCDPFNGSGTTGVVALREGRAYVGVDISAEYLENVTSERIAGGMQIGMGI